MVTGGATASEKRRDRRHPARGDHLRRILQPRGAEERDAEHACCKDPRAAAMRHRRAPQLVEPRGELHELRQVGIEIGHLVELPTRRPSCGDRRARREPRRCADRPGAVWPAARTSHIPRASRACGAPASTPPLRARRAWLFSPAPVPAWPFVRWRGHRLRRSLNGSGLCGRRLQGALYRTGNSRRFLDHWQRRSPWRGRKRTGRG